MVAPRGPLSTPGCSSPSLGTDRRLGGADGAVFHRGPSGWARTGVRPGQPQALLATADTLYAAVHDSDDRARIYRATDGGARWGLRYPDSVRDASSSASVLGVGERAGDLVAGGDEARGADAVLVVDVELGVDQ